jgi:tetratricopeptide (TPR) repeat protein
MIGELSLVKLYGQQGNMEGLKDIYKKLSRAPTNLILKQPLILDSVIVLSVVLGDEVQTPLRYQQYIALFPTTVKIETVMAAYYYKLGQYRRSLPHMRKALGMDPDIMDADRFKNILEKYSGSQMDEYQPEL